ncbi:MAG: 2,3-bisphosphoglycerate-independent phosphoglycerate mutase, partial [Candidatus Nanohaloarchaea archaeon]
HLHIGAGRTIPQELVRINRMIESGEFAADDAIRSAAETANANDGTVHIMGIASDGGVHGHIDHFTALMDVFAGYGCEVRTHPFLDGRDVQPTSADTFLQRIDSTADDLAARYEEDRNDYFVSPVIVEDAYEPVRPGDVVVFSNWRKDRARQLTRAFTEDGFDRFPTEDPSQFNFV